MKSIFTLLFGLFFVFANAQNYTVANAPTNSSANGVYEPNGTNNGVTAYTHVTNNFSMYRSGTASVWVICSGSPPFANCNQFIDFQPGSGSAPTPPLGTWDGGAIVSAALPIEMTFFEVKIKHGLPTLEWATSSEINNEGFYVEYSTDGFVFEEIGFVTGKGTSFNINQYFFSHNTTNSGLFFYRLKQVDFDGFSSYSEIVSIELNDQRTLKVFPNPANRGYITIQNGGNSGTIYNLLGQPQLYFSIEEEIEEVDISTISKGHYYMETVKESGEKSFSLLVIGSN